MCSSDLYKVCKSCGVSIFEGFGDLSLTDNVDIDYPSLAVAGDDRSPKTDTLAEETGMLVNSSAGRFSLLQKCSRLFKFSPSKKAEQSSEQEAERNIPFGARLEEASPSEDYEPTPVYQVANNSFDAEDPPVDTGARGNEESGRLDITEDVQMESSVGVADNCIRSEERRVGKECLL